MLTSLIGTQNDVIRNVAASVMESNRRMGAIISKLDKALRCNSAPTAVRELLTKPLEGPAAASSYALPTNRKRPCTALTVDDEQESRKKDAAFDVKRARPPLNAMTGQ
ncbi:hypothetical protein AAVH_19539, partial [Aphelenchoides avenae]